MEWIHVTQNRDCWQSLVYTLIDFKGEEFPCLLSDSSAFKDYVP